MRNNLLSFVFLISLFSASPPVFAHHGNGAYDAEATKIVKGTVSEWVWANPHCLLFLDTKDDKGNVTRWSVEASSPVDMIRLGWAANSLKAGDEVTVDVMPARNGAPVGRIRKVSLPNGKTLTTGAAGRYSN